MIYKLNKEESLKEISRMISGDQRSEASMEHAKEMIKIEAHYENELQKYMGGSSGTIRFGIHPRRTLYLLAKALPVFSARYPDVKLVPYEESTEQMIRHLLAGELDFAIVNESSSHPLLEYRPLYEDYMVAVVSAGHPLCTGAAKKSRKDSCPRIDLKQFNGERFILQKPDQSSRHYTDLAIAYDHAEPGQVFLLENLESACQLAAEGYGIAFNFYQYMKHFHYPKPVRCFRIGNPADTTSYSIVTLKGKQTLPAMEELIRLLRESA